MEKNQQKAANKAIKTEQNESIFSFSFEPHGGNHTNNGNCIKSVIKIHEQN